MRLRARRSVWTAETQTGQFNAQAFLEKRMAKVYTDSQVSGAFADFGMRPKNDEQWMSNASCTETFNKHVRSSISQLNIAKWEFESQLMMRYISLENWQIIISWFRTNCDIRRYMQVVKNAKYEKAHPWSQCCYSFLSTGQRRLNHKTGCRFGQTRRVALIGGLNAGIFGANAVQVRSPYSPAFCLQVQRPMTQGHLFQLSDPQHLPLGM